jgi:hypothetical protein
VDPKPLNIKEIVTNMSDMEKPLINAELVDLSNLNNVEMEYLSEKWGSIEVDRRRKIVARLNELAEENFELNFDSIFKNCLRDGDLEVRAGAIEGLWENEETALISIYIRMINEDSSEKVQAAAAKALSKYALLAETRKLGPASSSRVTQALLTILADSSKSREVWRRALEAAAPLSLPEVKKAIDKAYNSQDQKTRNSAIYAMGRNCDSAWMPILIKEMNSTSADARYEAAGACGEIGDKEFVPYLIKLSQDKDPDVQQAAILSLGKIGGVKAKAYLVKCAQSADEGVADAAEAALKYINAEADELF